MRNEPLEDAIRRAGLSEEQLADLVAVDQKTVERWLTGRVPHARTRAKVARALGIESHELWPDADPPIPPAKPTSEPPGSELLGAYPGRDDPGAPDPVELIAGARARIDLLDLTLLELIGDGVVEILSQRAQAGVMIRILIPDPASIHLVIAAHERDGHSDLTLLPDITWRVERAIGYLQPLLALPGVEARLHLAAEANSIIRADDQLRVALHLWGAPPEVEPLVHLEHHHPNGLFDRFAHHYELIWRDSTPLRADPARYPNPDQDPDRYRPAAPATVTSDPATPAPAASAATTPGGAFRRRRR